MADGSPELDVSMLQLRRTCSALALLGVIFPIWKSIRVVARQTSLDGVPLYGPTSSVLTRKSYMHTIDTLNLQEWRTSKQAALGTQQEGTQVMSLRNPV